MIKGPRRPYYNHFFSHLFWKTKHTWYSWKRKIIFHSSYAISTIIVACETRLTENGIPPEQNLRMVSLHSPQSYCTISKKLSKARLVVFASRKAFIPDFFIILHPLTRIITTMRRSCFVEGMAPLEAWIGGNISDSDCRQSSLPNNIGGSRTRTFLKLTNRWQSGILSVLLWGIFRVKEYIKLIRHLSQKDWGECML